MNHFREAGVGDTWKSLPEYFKAHGYVTMGSGKLFHPTVPPDNDWPKSWSTDQRYYSPECMPGGTGKAHCNHSFPPNGNAQKGNGPNGVFKCLEEDPPHGYTLCPTNTSKEEARFDYQLEDQRIRDSCVDQLQLAAKMNSSFFVACGFHKVKHSPKIHATVLGEKWFG
jgi:hypothetical protein